MIESVCVMHWIFLRTVKFCGCDPVRGSAVLCVLECVCVCVCVCVCGLELSSSATSVTKITGTQVFKDF